MNDVSEFDGLDQKLQALLANAENEDQCFLVGSIRSVFKEYRCLQGLIKTEPPRIVFSHSFHTYVLRIQEELNVRFGSFPFQFLILDPQRDSDNEYAQEIIGLQLSEKILVLHLTSPMSDVFNQGFIVSIEQVDSCRGVIDLWFVEICECVEVWFAWAKRNPEAKKIPEAKRNAVAKKIPESTNSQTGESGLHTQGMEVCFNDRKVDFGRKATAFKLVTLLIDGKEQSTKDIHAKLYKKPVTDNALVQLRKVANSLLVEIGFEIESLSGKIAHWKIKELN